MSRQYSNDCSLGNNFLGICKHLNTKRKYHYVGPLFKLVPIKLYHKTFSRETLHLGEHLTHVKERLKLSEVTTNYHLCVCMHLNTHSPLKTRIPSFIFWPFSGLEFEKSSLLKADCKLRKAFYSDVQMRRGRAISHSYIWTPDRRYIPFIIAQRDSSRFKLRAK